MTWDPTESNNNNNRQRRQTTSNIIPNLQSKNIKVQEIDLNRDSSPTDLRQ